ncbi:MAG: serine/threonine protein kinase [Oscillospiraceae bacterium]|nr:serine/threonine protein kinase [Oscillospiraceae bacterium]
MLQTGTLFDNKYKILSVLGKGGTSCVYLAENTRIKKTWAIKEVYKNGVDQVVRVKNGLIAETAILTKLRHPYLPAIIDVVDTPNSYYVVMEYIEGKPLDKVLEQNGAQTEANVIKWARQLCEVLHYLHTQQPAIIYRDMKPANIMLKPDGNVTLIDFGTAREYKSAGMRDTVHLGTRGYAAPEQYAAQEQSDARTDIYCLGVTLYHLITGHDPCLPPYGLRSARQINPSISSKLEQIIRKCTQLNPADRYQAISDLMRDLDNPQPIREYASDINFELKKRHTNIWVIVLIPILLAIGGIVAVVVSLNSSGGVLAKPPASVSVEDLIGEPLNDVKDVWLSYDGERKILYYIPSKSGIYYFYSKSGDEVPVIWLSDSKDNVLCDSNTYGANDEFDFSYRLNANQVYYLTIALYTLNDDFPKAGRIEVHIEFKPE